LIRFPPLNCALWLPPCICATPERPDLGKGYLPPNDFMLVQFPRAPPPPVTPELRRLFADYLRRPEHANCPGRFCTSEDLPHELAAILWAEKPSPDIDLDKVWLTGELMDKVDHSLVANTVPRNLYFKGRRL